MHGAQVSLSDAEQLDLAIAMSLSHEPRPSAQGPSARAGGPLVRPAQPPGQAQHVRCALCTFYNQPNAAECTMCGHTLGRGAAPSAASAAAPRAPSPDGAASLSADERQAAQEAQALRLLAHIEATCAAQRVPFVDDSFLPNGRSVYLDGREWARADVAERQPDARVTQWLRPGQIRGQGSAFELFNQPWAVFRGEPQPDDARQGGLGDCWLLSAIAVLAERPSLLRALFPAGPALSACGAYPVRLCLDGEWRVLVVDDALPCSRHGLLAFSQAARRQLYVPLLEKAFAKAYGCYEAIEAGTCDEALAALTGAPCEQLRLQPREGSAEPVDADLLWARLLSFREAGFLMGASCGARDARARAAAEAAGLQTMHAYSILDVRTSGAGDRLLRLRNPWGSGAWRGAWSARAPQWTTALRRELRPDEGEGGVFWMCWADFCALFRDVDVCKARAGAGGWMEARARVQMPTSDGAGAAGRWSAFRLEVFETTQLDLVLVQANARGRAEAGARAQLDLSVSVFRAAPGGTLGELCACSPRRVHPSVCCEAMLTPGDYLVVPLSLNQLHSSGGARPAILAAFSAKPVLVAPFDAAPELARHALVARAVRHGEVTAPFGGELLLWNLSDEAGSLLYAENRSWMRRFCVGVRVTESHNLVSSRASLQLDDRIAPGQGQLLLALTQLEPSEGYASALQFQFRADVGLERHEPSVPAAHAGQGQGLHSTYRLR